MLLAVQYMRNQLLGDTDPWWDTPILDNHCLKNLSIGKILASQVFAFLYVKAVFPFLNVSTGPWMKS